MLFTLCARFETSVFGVTKNNAVEYDNVFLFVLKIEAKELEGLVQ